MIKAISINFFLILVLLWLSIDYVFSRHQTRKIFAELQSLEQLQQEINTDWGRLQLEKSTLLANNRVESVAKNALDMKAPTQKQTVIIKR